MDLRKALFVGGNSVGDAAVKVRAVDIAARLGCDFKADISRAEQIPDQYSAFVCVRPELDPGELRKMAQRGIVIWDIVDAMPPRECVSIYLASTALAQELFQDYGRIEKIPHHHCNFEGTPNASILRRPVWLGTQGWLPRLRGFDHDMHFVGTMDREDVVGIFRKTGIGLNLRGVSGLKNHPVKAGHFVRPREHRRLVRTILEMHLVLTSGIKLINCIGFGIPSISTDEPAYREIGEEYTIFSSIKDCSKWVRALQSDHELYMAFRKKCLRKAKDFHIDTIALKYKTLLAAL
jgi:hypothetical protein